MSPAAVVKGMVDAWNRRDFEEYLSYWDEPVEWVQEYSEDFPADSQRFTKAGCHQLLTMFREAPGADYGTLSVDEAEVPIGLGWVKTVAASARASDDEGDQLSELYAWFLVENGRVKKMLTRSSWVVTIGSAIQP
jgi:hypothetical protein